ncbi:MAG: hypothetical protein LBD20_02955 [Spirochaetaceae bacterium]|jgi:hypothetical protein|nr:hypothetical protein [Spirochaetaceae bacterium]
MIQIKARLPPLFAAGGLLAVCLFSCRHSNEANVNVYDVNDNEVQESGSPLEPVNFGYASAATVNIRRADANNVILIKINKGNEPVHYEDTGKITETTGGSSNSRSVAVNRLKLVEPAAERGAARSALEAAGGERGYVHYGPAWEFNNNLPRRGAARAAALIARSAAARQTYSVGDIKNFWIDNVQGAFQQKQGKLFCTLAHADVWALKKDDGSFYISEAEAQTLAQKFDLIYSYETALLGHEYGGGTGGSGGVDGNPRVQILVYDIPQNGVAGYFWGKDAFADGSAVLQNLRSNEAEIFYIDSEYYTNLETRDSIYSTLVHEFQHMIQFNLKTINYTLQAGTWYNEMLSMLAEDVISPLIGIPVGASGHPATDRFPSFLTKYWISGITEHDTSSGSVVQHYANNYGFGAYLIRNYGGAPLLRAMIQNEYIDEKSILSAIADVNGPNFSGIQFDVLQKNLPVALFNVKTSGYTFVKESMNTVAGHNYTCYPVSILSSDQRYLGTHIFEINTFGNYASKIPARGFVCESANPWLAMRADENGRDLRIVISRPNNPNIKLYLLVL